MFRVYVSFVCVCVCVRERERERERECEGCFRKMKRNFLFFELEKNFCNKAFFM